MPPPHVLLADGDVRARLGLERLCRSAGYRVSVAASGAEALRLARKALPDVTLLDALLSDGSGLELLPALRGLARAPRVVVTTLRADVPTALAALRQGASDLLEKPVEREVLEGCLARLLRSDSDANALSRAVAPSAAPTLVARSGAARRVLEQVECVAATPRTTVLVTGESGVGKELVARAVHERSARSRGPFVAVNCAALSAPLFEAELFGYEPGAFTGAARGGRAGLFAAAAGGTLLLDEIGELPCELQAKLLRVLQERRYRRVGGDGDLPMDARVIAATNRELDRRVAEGRFREDLYYRLNVMTIAVPPLRERPDDVAPLAEHFRGRFAAEFGRTLDGFADGVLDELARRPWPGNVRELEHCIERACLLSAGHCIGAEHVSATGTARPAAAPAADRSLRSAEEAHVRRVLAECQGNKSRAARVLGVNRATLYNKLRGWCPVPEAH